MEGKRKTGKELMQDLQDMRQRFIEIEECGLEYKKIKKKYDALLESAPDAMIFIDREQKIVLVNAQAERLFGYSAEEVKGKNIDTLVPIRYRGPHREHVQGYFLNPRIRPMGTTLEIYGLRKDGSEFPADISLSFLETEGEMLGTAAVRDITERKRAEEQIERNFRIQSVISSVLKLSLDPIPLDAQLDRVLDLTLTVPGLALQSKGLVYLIGEEPDTFVLKASRGFKESGQAPCDKIISGRCLCGQAVKSCAVVFADCVDDRHERSSKSDFPHGHYCVPIVSGDRSLGLINVFVREGHERMSEEESFLSAIADTLAGVIIRYQVDQERVRLREELSQAEKLSALGRVASNVAHEIRNPLTSVGGFARRLKKKAAEGSPERQYADYIVSEVERLEEVLRDVLAYVRETGLHLEPCRIDAITEEALIRHAGRLKDQSIAVQKAFADIQAFPADRDGLIEAVSKILSNAANAMPKGGTLTVSTRLIERQGTAYALVRIEDTGTGIPRNIIDKIFEPFFTTKETFTGLGLPIAKKIVEAHRGFISVESNEGKGSAFSLYFPISE